MRAVSATVVVNEPPTLVWLPVGPGCGMRPWLALWPRRPVNDAGMRIDPPPSDAVPNGMRPADTAADVPPLDPLGVFVVSHGFRVTPNTFVFVRLSVPNSGLAVLPTGTAPAARRRATLRSSRASGPRPTNGAEPNDVGMPSQCSRSFTPNGTPASRPGSSPRATASSILAAAA